MIVGFRDKRTRDFAQGKRVKAFDGISRKAEMKLDQLDAATGLRDLDLPGNRLEALKGGRKGQHSIRINDQWRICFEWPDKSPGPINVEMLTTNERAELWDAARSIQVSTSRSSSRHLE